MKDTCVCARCGNHIVAYIIAGDARTVSENALNLSFVFCCFKSDDNIIKRPTRDLTSLLNRAHLGLVFDETHLGERFGKSLVFLCERRKRLINSR